MVDKVHWIAGGTSFTPSSATDPRKTLVKSLRGNLSTLSLDFGLNEFPRQWKEAAFIQGKVQLMLKWEGEELITHWKNLSASN